MTLVRDRAEQYLREVIAGRPIIILGQVEPEPEWLLSLGAKKVGRVVIGSGEARAKETAIRVAETEGEDFIGGLRGRKNLASEPPEELRVGVEEFDPEGQALVIGDHLNETEKLLGRPFLAWRKPEWLLYDDKTTVDALWDRYGVDRKLCEVVPAEREVLIATHEAVDEGMGTVWSGDNEDGVNGGATYVRWVRDDIGMFEAAEFFESHAKSVRVVPFLEGIPVSIHGIVLEKEVLVGRPVELLVLREKGGGLQYCGCATTYDVPIWMRDQMEKAVRLVGAGLRDEVGYRGGLTIDGIACRDGWYPNELNTRQGAGLGTQAQAFDVPLELLAFAVAGGWGEFDTSGLEEMWHQAVDNKRPVRISHCGRIRVPVEKTDVVYLNGRLVDKGESTTGEGVVGSISTRDYGEVSMVDLWVEEPVEPGKSCAEVAKALVEYMNKHFEGWGPQELEVAKAEV